MSRRAEKRIRTELPRSQAESRRPMYGQSYTREKKVSFSVPHVTDTHSPKRGFPLRFGSSKASSSGNKGPSRRGDRSVDSSPSSTSSRAQLLGCSTKLLEPAAKALEQLAPPIVLPHNHPGKALATPAHGPSSVSSAGSQDNSFDTPSRQSSLRSRLRDVSGAFSVRQSSMQSLGEDLIPDTVGSVDRAAVKTHDYAMEDVMKDAEASVESVFLSTVHRVQGVLSNRGLIFGLFLSANPTLTMYVMFWWVLIMGIGKTVWNVSWTGLGSREAWNQIQADVRYWKKQWIKFQNGERLFNLLMLGLMIQPSKPAKH